MSDVMNDADRIAALVAQAQLEKDDRVINELVSLLLQRGDVIQAANWLVLQDDLSGYDPHALLRFNSLLPKPFLNAGGGPAFAYPFWENLDSSKGPLNPRPFGFGADVDFPHKSGSFDLVYTSHTLEHLPDDVVEKLLQESRRVLKRGAPLLVKIPDFDVALAAFRDDDLSYFDDKRWGFPSVTPTLALRGMSDDIAIRAAYIFCGFWNSYFGDMFGFQNAQAVGAYNGPAAIGNAELRKRLSVGTPHEIASEMASRVRAAETDYTFNHQNAWSTQEMVELLTSAGFQMISTDKRKIVDRFSQVPKIAAMYDISAYYLVQ